MAGGRGTLEAAPGWLAWAQGSPLFVSSERETAVKNHTMNEIVCSDRHDLWGGSFIVV